MMESRNIAVHEIKDLRVRVQQVATTFGSCRGGGEVRILDDYMTTLTTEKLGGVYPTKGP